MLFWSTHQLDICHQYLKIISHNSETKSQIFLKGWKEITFIGNMVTVTVFFAFSISDQMYFVILLTSDLTNQPTNEPTHQPTNPPTLRPADQQTKTLSLTDSLHGVIQMLHELLMAIIWSKFPTFMEPKASSSCS
jgi:hypothetical protein